jgi:hypothetical protein
MSTANISGTEITFNIEGLKETRSAIRRSSRLVKKEINTRLRAVGDILAVEAQGLARSRGLEKSGKLVRLIKPRARSMSVAVVANAKRVSPKYPKGYNYPKRLEYENGGARQFMRPALASKKQEVVSKLAEVLDEISREFGSN